MGCGVGQGHVPPRLLFLLGGDIEVFGLIADDFIAAAGGPDATIAILLGGGAGWERHIPSYLEPWHSRGVRHTHVIVPDDDGQLDPEAASAQIREATAIVVGGGDTPGYQRLYATEPLRTVIRDRHPEGVPYAGLSAGALIASDPCVILPREAAGGQVHILPGLGLLQGLVIGVHFNRPGRLPYMLEAMRQTATHAGLGINEAACVVLQNGKPIRVLGDGAYEITLEDAVTGSYAISILAPR